MPIRNRGLIDVRRPDTCWKYEFEILQTESQYGRNIDDENSAQMSNNLDLINSPNNYSIIHVKYSFWSASPANLDSLLKSFQLVEMNEKLLTLVMKPVMYPCHYWIYHTANRTALVLGLPTNTMLLTTWILYTAPPNTWNRIVQIISRISYISSQIIVIISNLLTGHFR
jgi:hypothetical protein